MKWLLTVFIVLVILAAATPLLRRFGLGRIPGDFQVPVRGRMYYLPVASTLLFTLAVWLIGKFL